MNPSDKMIPIVIPLHPGGGKLLDDTELRYALRSLEQHFKEPFKIVIAGQKLPGWLVGVEHLQSAGLKQSLRAVADLYPEGFFWFYDDCCLLADHTAEEMRVTAVEPGWGKPGGEWGQQLDAVRARLVREGYEARDFSRPHGPYWFDKGMVDEGRADWPAMRAKFPWESWILSKRRWPGRVGVVRQYYATGFTPPGARAALLNYGDKGNTPELRAWLHKRFPRASAFERGGVGRVGRVVKDAGVADARVAEPEWVTAARPTKPFFIHIPKTGGTSVRAALGQNFHVDDGTHFPSDHPQFRAYARGRNLRLFAVVRNPYDRAWSIYKFFNKHKRRRPLRDQVLSVMVRHLSCEQFWMLPNIVELRGVVPHFKPQCAFVGDDVRLLRFETLDDDWRNWSEENGWTLPSLPRLQVSTFRDGGRPVAWEEGLSAAVKGRIAELYAEDFQRFGYTV